MRISDIREIFNSIILSAYMLFVGFHYFVSEDIRRIMLLSIVILSFSALIYTNTSGFKLSVSFNSLIKYGLIFSLLVLIELFSGVVGIQLLFVLTAPAFAYFLYTNKFKTSILYGVFLVISSKFLTYIIDGTDLNTIFDSVSRNYISVIMIFSSSIVTLIIWEQERKIVIIPVLLTFVVSLFAVGRSGIISSFILFIGLLFPYIKSFLMTNNRYLKFFISVFNVVIIVFVVGLIMYLLVSFELLDAFYSKGFESSARVDLIVEYINNIDFINFLFGYNFYDNKLFQNFGLNTHNSFLKLHHYAGFIAFIFLYYIIKASFILLKKNYVALLILCVLLLRSFTDTYLFFSIYDTLIIYILFLSFKQKKIIVNNDKKIIII